MVTHLSTYVSASFHSPLPPALPSGTRLFHPHPSHALTVFHLPTLAASGPTPTSRFRPEERVQVSFADESGRVAAVAALGFWDGEGEVEGGGDRRVNRAGDERRQSFREASGKWCGCGSVCGCGCACGCGTADTSG